MTDEQKKDIWDIIAILLIGLLAAFAASFGCTVIRGQNVVRNGYQFEQVSKKKVVTPPILTKYTFKALDGKVYPIYISAKGAVFIVRISKKGNKRPYYNLPKELKNLIRKEYGFKES